MQDSHLNPRVLSPFYLGSVEGVGRRGVLGGLVGDVRRRKVFPNNSGRWGCGSRRHLQIWGTTSMDNMIVGNRQGIIS